MTSLIANFVSLRPPPREQKGKGGRRFPLKTVIEYSLVLNKREDDG
jgi:hypothetical protein